MVLLTVRSLQPRPLHLAARSVEHVNDPTLNNMSAFSVTIPANWHFNGVLYQGGNCPSIPYGVFRATSPDGLTSVERLPAFGLDVGQRPYVSATSKSPTACP